MTATATDHPGPHRRDRRARGGRGRHLPQHPQGHPQRAVRGDATPPARVDPRDAEAVGAVAGRWGNLVKLLVDARPARGGLRAAGHRAVRAALRRGDPREPRASSRRRWPQLELLADRARRSVRGPSGRLFTHRLYLGLASFTSAYLQHQEFEELEVMVMLSQHVARRGAPCASTTRSSRASRPETMAQSASLMLPAMNIEDQSSCSARCGRAHPPRCSPGSWGWRDPSSNRCASTPSPSAWATDHPRRPFWSRGAGQCRGISARRAGSPLRGRARRTGRGRARGRTRAWRRTRG